MRRHLWWVTVALFILGSLGATAFLLRGPEIHQALRNDDVFKLTYQFLLLAVVGGGVSLIYQVAVREREERERDRVREREGRDRDRAREREQRERDRALQRDVRSSVVEAYNDAKKVRRSLRARALRAASQGEGLIVVGGEYDKQLQRLVDAQLALERAIHAIDADPALFAAAPDLVERLKQMEHYLSEIIGEYEVSYRTFGNDAETKALSAFPMLGDFVVPYEKSEGFGTRFKDPFVAALKLLTGVIRS